MSLANAFITVTPVDGQLNPILDGFVQYLDFDVVGGSQIELVYNPDDPAPYQILIEGEFEEAYSDRQTAQFAFDDLVSDLVSAEKEAEYQRRDYGRW